MELALFVIEIVIRLHHRIVDAGIVDAFECEQTAPIKCQSGLFCSNSNKGYVVSAHKQSCWNKSGECYFFTFTVTS